VNARDIGGYTPLHVAALTDARKVARLLLQNGADRSTKANNGHTASDLAKQAHHEQFEGILGG